MALVLLATCPVSVLPLYSRIQILSGLGVFMKWIEKESQGHPEGPYDKVPPLLGEADTKEEYLGKELAWEGLGDSVATKGATQVCLK